MPPSPARREYAALLMLSAAGLAFEINLTRLFSVAQFYHFAFMIVSLALLGSGASGTFLAVFPRPSRANPRGSLGWLALLSGLAMLGSYLLTNWLPFDSFSIAWDPQQAARLAAHYVALALPFFFGGMAVSLLLEAYPRSRGQVYAANLAGSALGCAVALALPGLLGGEGMLLLSCGLAALTGLGCALPGGCGARRLALPALAAALLLFSLAGVWRQAAAGSPGGLLALKLSPYKGLSYALQYPGARVVSTRWNAFSRVDRVSSPGIRSFPGMSYLYLQPLPPAGAIFIDGDDLSPVIDPGPGLEFVAYMPSAAAYALRPGAETLILEPRGGLEILIARQMGAGPLTAVTANPLVVEAAGAAYRLPGVRVVVEAERSYLQHAAEQYGVIVFALTSAYHPVRSGAYSLAEDYRFTVESFQDALRRLDSRGVLVVTCWLQTPPSEELRAFATGVAAVEGLGGRPGEQVAAFRGYNTLTLLLKRSPFTSAELAALRGFTAARAYDLVYTPDIDVGEVNRFNILPEPVYYQAFRALLAADPRADFYAAYPYEVSPPTDDRPFFSHLFKWSQAGQVLAELGRTWQPFGGAGYFVVLALLALALLAAAALILLPALLLASRPAGGGLPARGNLALLAYFGLIGFAYLLVEIPLIQRFILFLGQPVYALAAVLFTLLLFSGLGSRWSHRLPARWALGFLAAALLALPFLLPPLFRLALGLSLPLRLALTVLVLAPVGFLMGVPFPAGLRFFLAEGEPASRLPWVWAINGSASVVAAILAALLALSFGFGWVLRAGALCYAGAWAVLAARSLTLPARSRGR